MGEKGVGKLSRETPPPCEGEPMGALFALTFTFHLSPRLYPATADVALHQCLPLSSVCCFPVPGDSLLPCFVVLPSSAWSSS